MMCYIWGNALQFTSGRDLSQGLYPFALHPCFTIPCICQSTCARLCTCVCVLIGFKEIGALHVMTRQMKECEKQRGYASGLHPNKHTHTSSVRGREGNMNVKGTEIPCSLTDRQAI